ncbi:hypothetical protein TNCV_5085911 [Trichonephila clavipes]|uniref:Secreted protein n=1 Tax=Trichonephila clavipes TaxID=2585209 RepID=A0A8X6S6H2_TRICX|nr:hypothetical protein TNCV_5085911 [Trichonephila clavipes]
MRSICAYGLSALLWLSLTLQPRSDNTFDSRVTPRPLFRRVSPLLTRPCWTYPCLEARKRTHLENACCLSYPGLHSSTLLFILLMGCRETEPPPLSNHYDRPLVGVVWRLGEGCQLRCRPRHLTMVQNYVVRRQKPSCS